MMFWFVFQCLTLDLQSYTKKPFDKIGDILGIRNVRTDAIYHVVISVCFKKVKNCSV